MAQSVGVERLVAAVGCSRGLDDPGVVAAVVVATTAGLMVETTAGAVMAGIAAQR